jgi:hypothetical protein
MLTTPSATDIARTVIHSMMSPTAYISAFWVAVKTNREEYARELRHLLEGQRVVVAIVRDDAFQSPNEMMADLVLYLEREREPIATLVAQPGGEAPVGIVLLSHLELAIPQISSPALLPQWCGPLGGTSVHVIVSDITWVADCSFNAPELSVPEMSEWLFRLEQALLRRLASVHRQDHRKVSSWYDTIKRANDGSFSDFLTAAVRANQEVHNRSAFRPSVRSGDSLIARIWAVGLSSSSDQLLAKAKALATALDVIERQKPSYESVLSVLYRSSNDTDLSFGVRLAKNTLMTVCVGCQWVTIAAHAAEYPSYPVILLSSISKELRKSFAEIIACIEESNA